MKFENTDMTYSYTASNYDPRCTDLTFTKNGTSYLFRNVPSPEGWDGESDWIEDETYVMKAISDMTPEEV